MAGSLLCLTCLFMAVVSVRGPLYFWYLSWASPFFRVSFLMLCIAGFLWLFFALYAVSKNAYKAMAVDVIGNFFVALGAVLVFNGILTGVIGLETFLTAINNQMAVLPLSLSKVLGITTHLNMNPSLPTYGAACGVVLACGGWILRRLGHRAHPR
jgi:hypothetical protein